MKKCVLGDVARSIQTGPFGSQLHQSDYTDCGTPVVMPKDVVNGDIVDTSIARVGPQHVSRLSRHQLRPGNLIFSRRGDVGRCALVKKEQNGWLCGTGCLRVVVDEEKINSSYLYYFLCQSDVAKWLESHAVGAIMLNINPSIVSQIPISFPTRGAQEQIANLLSALDRKIALNRRKIATLEKMAKEIYDYWFVQYDFPDANGRPYKSSGGEMVYSPELKREIPKGWRVGCLADIAQYPQETVRSDAIDIDHYVTTDSLLQEKLGRTQASNLPPVPVSLVAFQKADTLVANIRPYLKKIWYASEDGGCSQDVLVFHPINNELAPLLHSIVWQDAFFDYVMAAAKGSKMPRGDKAHIMAYPILLPDKSVVRRFGEVVEKFYAWRECALKESASLTALRDYLLPLLMNGQVKVGEWYGAD